MRRGRNVDDALYADRVWFTPRRPAWFSCPRPPAPTACRNLGLYCDGSPPLKRRRTFVSADVSAGRRRERETAHPSRPPVLRTEMKNAVTAAFFCVASPKWAAQTAGIRPPSARDSNLQNRPACLTTGTETCPSARNSGRRLLHHTTSR